MSETTEHPTTSTALAVLPANLLPTILGADKDDILGKLSRKVAAFKPDVSTNKGRAEMRSLAAEIASAKMDLIRIGKGLTETWRKSTKAVNEECNLLEERMNELRDKVRQQLTDFENAEKARVATHEAAIANIDALAVFEEPEPTPEAVADRLAIAERGTNRDWEEFKNRAAQASLGAVTMLTGMLAIANKREADRAELARLKAEEEERERQEAIRQQAEREARIAAEAAETAKRAAERIAAEQAAEAARAAAAEQERIEAKARAEAEAAEAERLRIIREAQEAEERAAVDLKAAQDKAEADRLAAEQREREATQRAEKAEADRIAAAEKAERDRLEAERLAEIKAERERIAAVEAERKGIADARAAEEAERKRREENKAHRTKINREAVAAILLAMSEVHKGTPEEAEEYARAIITAIAKGLVPNCQINY